MAWNYSCNPAGSNRDAVRFLSGQTSTGDPILVQDEEINYVLNNEPNAHFAAAAVCEILAGKYSDQAQSVKVGETEIRYAQERHRVLLDKAKALRAQGSYDVTPYLGGESITERTNDRVDTDLRQPAFKLGQDDFPGSIPTSSG